jgi:hypothetical protein
MPETIFSTPIQNAVQKQLDATLAASATSVVLNADVSALFTGTDATHPCVCVVDRVDANGNLTPTKREYIKFTGVSTTTLTGCTRNADSSGSDQEHSVGAIVEFIPDVLWAKSLQDNYVDTSSAQTLTNKTLTLPKINENVAVTSTATELNLLTGVTGTVATIAGTQALTNKTLIQKVTTLTPTSSPQNLDVSLGNIFNVTMYASLSLTLTVSNEAVGECFMVEINNVTSQGALTWFQTISWSGGVTPTLTGTNGKKDVFGFRVTGTDTYWGCVVAQNI